VLCRRERAAREDVVAGLGAARERRERHAGRERARDLGQRLRRVERVGAREAAGAARRVAGVAEHAAVAGHGDDQAAAGDRLHARDHLLEVHDVCAGARQRVVARDGERLHVGGAEPERRAIGIDPRARDIGGRTGGRTGEVALGVEDRPRRAEAVVPRDAGPRAGRVDQRPHRVALCGRRRDDRLGARVERIGARRDPVDALRRGRHRNEHEHEQRGACHRRGQPEPHGTSP
jgi:hypothetical protein